MTDLVVVVPSRDRAAAAWALVRVFADTCTASTQLLFAVDADDPNRDDYPPGTAVLPSRNMGEALNMAALSAAEDAFAVGFMGDDHHPRTRGWDEKYLDALREIGTGIVYGDDLMQGWRLPTQCAMTSDIVRALGYMAPPSLIHLYLDNFWLQLGTFADCIRYLPDVVVEHMHPFAGKATWDVGYVRVNDPAMYEKDMASYGEYVRTGRLARDVEKVRALRAAHV